MGLFFRTSLLTHDTTIKFFPNEFYDDCVYQTEIFLLFATSAKNWAGDEVHEKKKKSADSWNFSEL